MTIASKTPLASTQLANDPRLAEAKKLILEAVAEHQSQLTGVRPPNPELADSFQSMLDEFGKIRGGNLYFPYLSSGIGNGPFVELADGSVKLDMITGIGVHGYGHSHPELVATGIDAAVCDTVMQGNLQQNTHSYEIAKLLTDVACESGAGLQHCFMSTSGAMANENALKIAFQKHAPANRVISFAHCFAGRSLALSQVTDKPGNRVGLPDTIAVDFIPFFDPADPEGSTERTVNRLQELVNRHPGKYACLWMELIQGEGGYHSGSPEFFAALCKIAKENNIAVIADEVQTFCRTSRPYAFQHFGMDKMVDLVTIGKISQVCATLYTDEYRPKPGLISQTFTGSTWAILAAKTIVQGLIDKGNFGDEGRNMKLNEYFANGLKAINDKYPGSVGGPHGVGGMVAFTPFNGEYEVAKEMVNQLYHAGLMSFFAGKDPSRVRFLMPLGCVEESHIDLACQILESVVKEMQ